MTDVNTTLTTRNDTHGDFDANALVSQAIKAAMQNSANWLTLRDDMKETLELIALKISRILGGDHMYQDHWHDIIGYARLIERTLEGKLL